MSVLKPEFKAKWVAALRSGQYRQGQGWLHPSPDSYCCLGVACDISGRGEWIGMGDQSYKLGSEVASMGMPQTLIKEIVEEDKVGEFSAFHSESLVRLNDRVKSTFPEIADWIEANL